MKPKIMRLRLAAPLLYRRQSGDPFGTREEGTEELFCFEVNPQAAAEFEPDRNCFLGSLIFSGAARPDAPPAADSKDAAQRAELPRGDYLFTQVRDFLKADEVLDLAIELQKEGLWQRLEPGKLLYLRYLTEDRSGVTQVLRPCVFED